MRVWQPVVLTGWTVYLASFFLPAAALSIKDPLTDLPSEISVVGWEALLFVSRTKNLIPLTSELTNLLMIASPLVLWAKARWISKFILPLMTGATGLNLWWWFVASGKDRYHLMIGYYLWWGAFATVAIGLWLLRRQVRLSGGTMLNPTTRDA